MVTEESTTATEEAIAQVEIDQRALVEKILARYSGEFSLFRELLQNADDAEAHNAEIRFETAAYQQLPEAERTPLRPEVLDLKLVEVAQWACRNDGKPFEEKGWKRLPRIAAGNPDPEKIGAFGVGFYTIFSVTDKPCVTSGGHKMQFFWKDNKLYTSRRDTSQQDNWTTFTMPLREPRQMLVMLDFMRFLASSITFTVNLTAVGVFLDDVRIGHIKKSFECPQIIDLPKEIGGPRSGGIVNVKEVHSRRITIETEVDSAVYGHSTLKESSTTETSKSQLSLTIFTAQVDTEVDEKLSNELYRCMKKKPPARLKYSLIYTGKDDYDRNSTELRKYHPDIASIFHGLEADLEGDKHTRIFIGHATGQTTSIGGHMASRFIPTVERESIDFVDEYVSIWNKQLLYVGGLLCRVVYERELSNMQSLWETATTGTQDSQQPTISRSDLDGPFLHILNFFAFRDSTPSPKVAQILRESFLNCSSSPLRLLSSIGIRDAPNIRAFDADVIKFLDSIPMLSEHVTGKATRQINHLLYPSKIIPVKVDEVLQALASHPLSEEKLAFCLEWWLGSKRKDPDLLVVGLHRAVTFSIDDVGGTPRPLSDIKCFINTDGLGTHIPLGGPLPASLIPFNVSRRFTSENLLSFGWKDFTLMDWFQYATRDDTIQENPTHDFTKSPDWALCMLRALSRAWSSFSEVQHSAVKAVFNKTTCIPTSDGLRLPGDSYLPSANDDLLSKFGLPIVAFTGFELDREMLSFIGVQTHIPLELLSKQMLNTGEWSIFDYINYLTRLSPPLTTEQVSTLKSSPLFTDEDGDKPLCCADQLYPSVETFRRLGLPVIKWDKKSKWADESPEATLLYRLGLNHYPSLSKIIELCASPNPSVRETAFTYFCDNLQTQYTEYNPKNFGDVAFVPAENNMGTCLGKLGDVFLGAQWKALGFSIVQNAHQKANITELGIRQDPSPLELISSLEKRPPSYEEALDWFECLNGCVQNFSQAELAKLGNLEMVPESRTNSQKWLAPTECYLGSPTNDFNSKLFVFVNFGTKANYFLSMCGTTNQPSATDMMEALIRDPARFYQLAEKPEGFLDKLRDLATRVADIPNDTLDRMKRGPTLLGKSRKRASDHDEWETVYNLRVPDQIVIIDDSRDYELFGDVVDIAPSDELERFYSSLGCRRLSTVIHERYEDSLAIPDAKTCSEIRNLVLQRLPSFLQKCLHYQYDRKRVPKAENFHVKVCERLLVHKNLIIGSDKSPREQDTWAVAKYDSEKGIVELWISRHAKRDMYDLAASLYRLLFGTVRHTETVLLGAMLSDSGLLKPVGFEDARPSESKPSQSIIRTRTRGGTITADDNHSLANVPLNQGSAPRSAAEQIRYTLADSVNNARDTYRTVKRKLVPSSRSGRSTISRYAKISRQGISQEYIQDIANKATEASSSVKLSEGQIQFLRDQSCNDFAQASNLQPLGTGPEGIEFHATGAIADPSAFKASKQESLGRFIQTLKPVASAHQVPLTLLHVFYDGGEGPIAFNSKGNIYLNMRYFEEWHDEDVKNGRLRRAQQSWYFALAHEVAHNLIPSHDAAHAFWFSAVCGARLDDFMAAIADA